MQQTDGDADSICELTAQQRGLVCSFEWQQRGIGFQRLRLTKTHRPGHEEQNVFSRTCQQMHIRWPALFYRTVTSPAWVAGGTISNITRINLTVLKLNEPDES